MRHLVLVLLMACGSAPEGSDPSADTDVAPDTDVTPDTEADTEVDTDTTADSEDTPDAPLGECNPRAFYAGCASLELSTDVNTGATTRQDTTWDDRGNVVRVTYYESPDAELQPTVVDSVVDFTYTLDRLDRYTYTRDGNLLADYGYTYDANDLLLEYADAIGGTRRTFEYDANGNRVTQRGYASNGVENFVETYEYDANGNLVVTSSDTNGDGRVDTRCNRSWSVTMSGGTAYNETCTGGISSSVVFDSRGLTLSSEYRTPFDMTEKTTTWRDDCQPEVSEEVNVAATVITSYVYDADQRQTRTARDYNGNETFFKTTTYTCD